ncbi:MAG: hypothetical protein HY002_12750 [Candidatus Rokubacteria bacterium]|nr:hypothetical protein [Candidatus Rokubacteria bacterium]
MARRAPAGSGRGYLEIARWRTPAGEGRFITVTPDSTPATLRAAGERLRAEFRRAESVVVMIFDDADAARDARRLVEALLEPSG